MNVDVRKLKAVLVILIILLVIIVGIIVFGNTVSNKIKLNKNNESISTDVSFDISNYAKVGLMADYTNPSPLDMNAAYEAYGYERCHFVEEGLIVDADIYTGTEERFFTNIWPNREHTNSVIKPEFGIIDLIEDSKNYLSISLMNVSKSDINEYTKKIEDTFSYGKESDKKNGVWLSASNGKNIIVSIRYNASDESAKIYYEFF